jgi:hypothetical protein
MIRAEEVLVMDCTKEKMWSIWADVENWNQWVGVLDSSKLNGPLENGTKGVMKTISGRKSSFTIDECAENEKLVFRSKILFCTMYGGHEMKEEDDKLSVKLYIDIRGLLSFVFKKAIKKEEKGLKTALEKLAELACQ